MTTVMGTDNLHTLLGSIARLRLPDNMQFFGIVNYNETAVTFFFCASSSSNDIRSNYAIHPHELHLHLVPAHGGLSSQFG